MTAEFKDAGTGGQGEGEMEGKFSGSPTLRVSISARLILARDRFGIKPLLKKSLDSECG